MPGAPKEVLDLVERFEQQLDSYKSGRYNETQLRREFLDPFLAALGWDVDNTAGYAEAYKDVIHEDAIRVGEAIKAPDYCLRIGGTRKFFLEAKKPSVDIKEDVAPAYQLRRYAWSAKLPMSILSDFEEFAVYDCRIKPGKDDKASLGRIFYCTFRDYAVKWDWIYSIFSREAVLKGSFDKFVETNKGKRGTSEVDEEFLGEIEGWRKRLAENLALRNPKLSQRELNFAVQRIIDRIIFLRICEDRGIEDYGRLRALVNGDRIYPRLTEVFADADRRYNSGLFHFKRESGRHEAPDELTPGLEIDDKLLRDLFRGLYYPDSPYQFSVISADILGQVYEQFLGKVIRLTEGHRAAVDDKPEVKKAGGVYYTPTYIVDYIVQQTVGKLIEGKTPRQVEKIKILDPACGSGSFLIGAYQFLLDWHLKFYLTDGPGKWAKGNKPALVQTSQGWRLTVDSRKRILLNNLYGVDIDMQAVEVTKLSLLLKVLEGETGQTLQTILRIFQERALPDLGDNIKCGNSLIGPDFYQQGELMLLTDEDKYRINVFDWQAEFPDVFRHPPPAGELRETAASELDYTMPGVPLHGAYSRKKMKVKKGAETTKAYESEWEGGFDAVIGNPPYGAYLYEQDKAYLSKCYPIQTYQLDTYLLFLEQALRKLIARGGYYGMIMPNPWLTNLLQTSIRRFVVENSCICSIIHFKFPVFPKVVVDTEIVVLQKRNPKNWEAKVAIVDTLQAFVTRPWEEGVHQIGHTQQKWRDLDGGVINIFTSESEERLAAKCVAAGFPLSSFCNINVGIKPYQVGKGSPPQTRRVVTERPFDSNRQKDASYRPCLRGTDIGRFKIVQIEPRHLKYGPWLAEPRPAANFDAPMKILMRQTGDSLIAALDTRRFLCLNNMHVIVPNGDEPSPYYLIGVINSKFLNWYYHTLNPEVGEALAEVKKTHVAGLPIKFTANSDRPAHDRMVKLVKQMLALNKQLATMRTPHEKVNLERQIAATDGEIDRLVYQLYELTDDEIKLVEGNEELISVKGSSPD